MTNAPPAVTLRALRRVFGAADAAVTALAGVDLTFAPGSFTAVMGPSGSGKSTLLHCAAGLDRPTTGVVEVAGTDLTTLSPAALTRLRRTSIGFVFQEFNLVTALTAAQNVALPLRLARRRPPPSAVEAALNAVGLADRSGHRPSELSGGQQQRVAIARALVTRPAVVFADEPTGSLDVESSRQVLSLLRSSVDAHGQTVVMVTHDPVAASVADRVVYLVDGRVVDDVAARPAAEIAARIASLEA
jgi:putative ABC transport system ATP-binding protein